MAKLKRSKSAPFIIMTRSQTQSTTNQTASSPSVMEVSVQTEPAPQTSKFKTSTNKKRYRPGDKALKEIRHYQKGFLFSNLKKSSNNFRFYYIKFFTSFIGTGLLIPRSPFTKVIKQICEELTGKASIRFSTKVKYLNVSAFSNYVTSYLRFTSEALEALQVASEAMITQLFEDSVLVMVNAKRLTLMVRDLQLVRRIRGTL